jgi:hypothetical protein
MTNKLTTLKTLVYMANLLFFEPADYLIFHGLAQLFVDIGGRIFGALTTEHIIKPVVLKPFSMKVAPQIKTQVLAPHT